MIDGYVPRPRASAGYLQFSAKSLSNSFVVAAALAGCSTPTVTRTETVEVKVPVAVQPIRAADIPTVPAPLPKRPTDARAALDVALAKVCEFVAYAINADPLLRISAGEPKRSLPAYKECEGR